MKPEKRITKLAQDLCNYQSYGWLASQLGINYRTLKTRMEKHSWWVTEAEVINRYHELLIKEVTA